MPLAAMRHGAAGLGQRGVEQVRANGSGRRNAKDQHEKRCHQRAATDAGQADNGADCKAGKGVEVIHGPHRISGDLKQKEY
jgi:hypothetical protein